MQIYDEVMTKSLSCFDCKHSRITIMNNYLQCKLTGNCYVPSVMKDRISENCPLYKNIERKLKGI